MADNTDGILFTGDFDASEFTAGIDKMIASTKKMEEQEAKLQKELAETEAQLKKNREELNKTVKQQQAGDKSAADYASRMKALATQADDLRKKNEALNATVIKQRAELDTASKSVVKMKETYEAAGKAVQNFDKAGANIGSNISGTKLFGKLGEIKDKVGAATAGIAGDLAAGGTIETGLSGLGSAFGVFGGVAVAALIPLIKKLYELNQVETESERATRILNESLKAYSSASAQASSDVDVLKIRFDLAKQGLLSKDEVLKEYNDTLGKTLGVTKDFNVAEQALIENAETYIKIVGLKAQAQALANLKIAESEKKLKAELNVEDKSSTASTVLDAITAFTQGGGFEDTQKEFDKRRKASRARFNRNIQEEADANIKTISEAELRVQTELANAQLPFKDKPKEFGKAIRDRNREIQNIYEQELQKLREEIARINSKIFTDEGTITKAVEEDFKKRSLALDKAFKKGQLTSGQLAALKENLQTLQDLTLEKDINAFQEKRRAFLSKIEDTIQATQLEAETKRIENLQDSFERERQTIEIQAEKTAAAVLVRRDKLIEDLRKNAAANGVTPADLQSQIDVITGTYESLLEKLEAIRIQKLQKLSFDTFEKLSEDAKRLLDVGNLGVSEGSLINIQEQTELFKAGKISYQQYQKELTAIARFEANARFQLQKLFLEAEILRRQQLLKIDKTLTDDQIKKLKDEITALKQQLTSATAANTTANAGTDKASKDERIQNIVKYVQAISSLTQSVIGFWQQMNEAESKALDRSIAIQQRRVDAAKVVAARGNAEYLRLEEERLQALEIKRENAARRQLAINAALQASQVITALISGIAQGASVGGPLGAIIGLTAIVGAIASGFAIAKSLQPQQPSFFVGTEDTGRGGNADGKGGFHATLHPHERVLTAEQNKHMQGISNEKLVELVNNSRWMIDHNYASKPLPRLNLAAIDKANEISNVGGIRLVSIMEENNRKLEENNQLQRRTHTLLKGIGVNVNVDRNGLAISVLEAVDTIQKSKKL